MRTRRIGASRTAGGKSLIYFIGTRVLRDRGQGPTLIVSPLLALMRNQLAAAERLGIRAISINSTNREDWPALQAQIIGGKTDALLISLERLANDRFVEAVLLPAANRIGLLVVDEAHCISDWGHDFRPDYRRLVNILKMLNGVEAHAYYSGVEAEGFPDSDACRQHLEERLLANGLKALVATTALGMGYDKPDLGFVIHYQAPGSIVAYYQQVGRAGRAIDRALGLMMAGREDEDIHQYFRSTAFPDECRVNDVLAALEGGDGLSVKELQAEVNLTNGQIKQVLKYLSVENPAPVIRQGGKWFRTPVPYRMDHDRIRRLTRKRELEWQEVQGYVDTQECLMAYLGRALDDPSASRCKRCANCLGRPVVPVALDPGLVRRALLFIRQSEIAIEPRVQVPKGAFVQYALGGNLPAELRAEEGRVLSRWGDAGWGGAVREDKHSGAFRDELVEAAAEMILDRWRPQPPPAWVACVPSLKHPALVPDFAKRLAARLKLPFKDVLAKVKNNQAQKLQRNSWHQCRNLDGAFEVKKGVPGEPVLLVDDLTDSRWTGTVIAALLRQAGSGPVFPVALASTSTNG